MGATDRIVAAIAREPWLISAEGMELVLAVAQRRLADSEAAAVTRSERAKSFEDAQSLSSDVAVIPVFGVLTPRADAFTDISGMTSVNRLQAQLSAALEDPDVKGIVLNIDSPGGQVAGIHEFARQVYAARNIKPIVAYVGATGASAAYWIASSASEVVADRTAQIGSIGCVMAYTDRSKAREASGVVEHEIVSSQSPRKRLTPLSEEGRAAAQLRVDELADVFISEVACFRGVSVTKVESDFGQGGTLMAEQAVTVGMADRLGSLDEVINGLAGRTSSTGAKMEHQPTAAQAVTCQERIRALQEADAEVFGAIRAEAISEERSRIKSIVALNTTGHEQLAHRAMFESPMTAEELELAMFRVERKHQAEAASAHREDAMTMGTAPAAVRVEVNEVDAEAAQMIAGARRKKGVL